MLSALTVWHDGLAYGRSSGTRVLPETAAVFFFPPPLTISRPRSTCSIRAGLPDLLPPIPPDKGNRKETERKERKNYPQPAESPTPPSPSPRPRSPAASQSPSRPLPSPGFLGPRPPEGLTPCAPCVVGRVTSTPWPTDGPPSSPSTRWPRRGVALNNSCTWPPRVCTHGPARRGTPQRGTGSRTSGGLPCRGCTWPRRGPGPPRFPPQAPPGAFTE